jgi:2-desacetyl-2-hydroxyethyl bacteriochlorophyllide A dehydrogenase
MVAARFTAPEVPLSVEPCPLPKPATGQVLVRVEAAGVCGSDVHMWHGNVAVRQTPIVLGHEIAGVIAESGSETAPWKPGDRVIVRAASGCGACARCQEGEDNLCPNQTVLGMDADGGFAQYVLTPVANLVPLPGEISFETGAIVTDAVATPYHALKARGQLRTGKSVVIFGCGGLGTHAVQLARLLGASPVVAVDVRPAALDRARSLGADAVIDNREEAAHKSVQRLTEGGADLALDFVGRPETAAQAIRCLRPGGQLVIVGMGQQPISLPPPALFAWREHAALGSFGSTRRDVDEVIGLVQSGRLDLSGSVTGRFPLAAVNEALEILERGESDHVRLVITPWEEGA